jgi:hypothetical protein
MYIKTKQENKYIKGPFTSLTKGRVKQIYLADFKKIQKFADFLSYN